MIRHSRPGIILRLIVIGALFALVASACSSDSEGDGISQADVDALQDELDDANAELVAMQDQLVTAR